LCWATGRYGLDEKRQQKTYAIESAIILRPEPGLSLKAFLPSPCQLCQVAPRSEIPLRKPWVSAGLIYAGAGRRIGLTFKQLVSRAQQLIIFAENTRQQRVVTSFYQIPNRCIPVSLR
jgi:hypothetical protein